MKVFSVVESDIGYSERKSNRWKGCSCLSIRFWCYFGFICKNESSFRVGQFVSTEILKSIKYVLQIKMFSAMSKFNQILAVSVNGFFTKFDINRPGNKNRDQIVQFYQTNIALTRLKAALLFFSLECGEIWLGDREIIGNSDSSFLGVGMTPGA